MNRSKIEWCDHTWNPITGCLHNCPYCYAKRMVTRFAGDVRLNKMANDDYITEKGPNGTDIYIMENPLKNETNHTLVYPFGFEPTFHRYRLNALDKLKMGNNIFVGAMTDMFGEWIPDEWIEEIFTECKARPQHNYMFLTKTPERYCALADAGKLPENKNFWYGSTITKKGQAIFDGGIHWNTFISIEPVLEYLDLGLGSFGCTKWIIIGVETGTNKGKIVPEKEWIDNIIETAEITQIPVFMKDSVIPIVGEENMRRELPEGLKKQGISPKLHKKLFDNCSVCKRHLKKSEMVTLLARTKRGNTAKSYAFMCRDCFEKHCKMIDCIVPDLFRGESEE